MSKGRDSQGWLATGRFDDPAIERAFLRQYRAGGLRNLAWAAGIGVLAYTAFAVEHAMRLGMGLFGDPIQLAVMGARLLVVLVCLGVVLLIVHAPRRVLEHHVAIMSSALLLTLVPVALFAPAAEPFQHAHFRSLTGFSLTACAVIVLLRLPVWIGASCSLIALSVLVASIVAHEQWTVGLVSLVIYPVTAVLLGLVVAHVIEHRERALFAVAAGARRLSAEKTRLIGELAHDMRGPLAAIGNEVDALQRQAAELAPADLARRLATVEDSILHTRAYLEHLLAWCRAAGGDQPVRLGPVELDRVMLRLKADLAAQAARSGVVLSVEVAPEAQGVSLLSHEPELYSILHNLTDNAIKYRDDQPGTPSFVRVRAMLRGARCELEVSDNGIGMDPGSMRYIWDVGYRISRMAGATAGSGLGLAIVKARVERLEAHVIGVESAPGVGSRFWLRVPLADQAEAFMADLPAAADLQAAGVEPGLGRVGAAGLDVSVDLKDWAEPQMHGSPGPGPDPGPPEPRTGARSGRVLVLGVHEQRWPGLRRRLGPFGETAQAVHDPAGLEQALSRLALSFDVILIDGDDDADVRRLIEVVRRDHGYEVPAIVLRGSYRRWVGRAGPDTSGHIRHLARLASCERLQRLTAAAIAESLEIQRQLLDQEG